MVSGVCGGGCAGSCPASGRPGCGCRRLLSRRADDQLFLGLLDGQVACAASGAGSAGAGRRRAHGRRQVARGDLVAAAQHHGVFDRRCAVRARCRATGRQQQVERLGGETRSLACCFPGELAQKGLRQQRNVFHPLAQRRQPDFHHLQPKVEVFAERAGFDQVLEVLVGGGDQAYVRREGFV